MPCPDTGALRAWLDETSPAASENTGDPVGDHVAGCPVCTDIVAGLRRDAGTASGAVALLAPPTAPAAAEVEAALARVSARLRAPAAAGATSAEPAVVREPRPRRRFRVPAAVAAGVLAVAVAVATPAGRGAAAQFLDRFRSDSFTAVTVDPDAAGTALRGLERMGEVNGDLRNIDMQRVGSVAEAARIAGFEVVVPDTADLPEGVNSEPQATASPGRQLRFTFEKEKAAAYLKTQGKDGIALPDRFDGVSLVVKVPSVVGLVYTGDDGRPRLVVGQAGRLEVSAVNPARNDANPVTLEELRAFLLKLPALPPETARQLAAVSDWRTTLPLPVAAGSVKWRDTTVQGSKGLLFANPAVGVSAVLWQRDGRVWGVAGRAGEEEVLRVAGRLG
jgi:hypothetical protein